MRDLRDFTPARVGLGRTGNSIPTKALLAFQLAHARARDAVHYPFDSGGLLKEVEAEGWRGIVVRSAARNRTEYLRRPDLGRQLDMDSKARLAGLGGPFEAVFVVGDGLSALAVARHAMGVLRGVMAEWGNAPVVIVEQARVAVGDAIGEALGARLSVVLIGERPGLGSPDSLGIYLTWAPRAGRTDAERNCISNIRAEGLSAGAAAELLRWLMREARTQRISGLGLDVSRAQTERLLHGPG